MSSGLTVSLIHLKSLMLTKQIIILALFLFLELTKFISFEP